MLFLEKIKKILFKPTEFFREIKKEVGVGEAFKYLAIVSLIYVVLTMVLKFISSFFFIDFLGFSFVMIIGVYVLSLVGSFVGAGILHLFVKIFGGKNDYSATYKASVYSSTPTLLLGWVPWLNAAVSFYSWYLSIKGLSILHEVSTGRAFLITLVPVIIILGIIFFIIFLFLSAVYTSPIYAPMIGSFLSILYRAPFFPKIY